MSRADITLDSPIRDFWDHTERCEADGPDVHHDDLSWIAFEALRLSEEAHPDRETQRKWLLVARTALDKAIGMLDAERSK